MISLHALECLLFIVCLFGSVAKSLVTRQISDTYMERRQRIILTEDKIRVGGDIVLTPAEEKVNAILMHEKQTEINASWIKGAPFAPSIHFFHAKKIVEESKVFQILKQMPKGAALHLHDVSLIDPKWLIKNVTYMDNCYMCYDKNKTLHFHFFKKPPSSSDCAWKKVNSMRNASGNAEKFDQMLYNELSLIVDDPTSAYPDINEVWRQFLAKLDLAGDLINYAPVFSAYFTEALRVFAEDNVQYIEVRGLLPEVYELDGSTHNKTWVVQAYQNAIVQFMKNHPMFSGAKIIYSALRIVKRKDILQDVKDSIELLQRFPNHFAGFDLVGQEDPGKTLLDYLEALTYPSSLIPPVKLPYFFHAGETDWQGTPVDFNLIDAMLLNTSRIGHGYALTKHPVVMKMVTEKQVAVEINPISNQVLKLVDDLRNHPAASMVDQGLPVVISADDPGLWGAQGLSYDFYMAFMGLCGENTDLRVLKKLALNSLMYSAMSDIEKANAIKLWEQKWMNFVNEILHKYIL